MKPQQSDDEHAKSVLSALNHELRRRIMRMFLIDKVKLLSPTEASHMLNVSLSSVSYHLRVLAQSKAVDITLEQPVRGSVRYFYRANSAVAKMPMVTAFLTATSATD